MRWHDMAWWHPKRQNETRWLELRKEEIRWDKTQQQQGRQFYSEIISPVDVVVNVIGCHRHHNWNWNWNWIGIGINRDGCMESEYDTHPLISKRGRRRSNSIHTHTFTYYRATHYEQSRSTRIIEQLVLMNDSWMATIDVESIDNVW